MKPIFVGVEDIAAATRKRGPYRNTLLFSLCALNMTGCYVSSNPPSSGPYSPVVPAVARSGGDPVALETGKDRVPLTPTSYGIPSDDILVRSKWSAFAWHRPDDTPIAIELEYVIPEKFLDEDSRPWREEMFRRFGPLVKDCKTRGEAIMLIAKNAEKLCGVKYSTERRAANQCAAESLQSGKATCTGLSILLAAAYRSVGIPARIAGVGEWGDRGGNHTWVEVRDGDWHVVEYYPDEKGLDRGWIYEPIMNLDPANPRSRVMAVGNGGTLTFFLPWDENNTSIPAIDRTEVYQRRAAELGVYKKKARAGAVIATVVAQDSAGKRVAKDFRILDGVKEIFVARTPGPLADLNDTPRVELSLDHDYIVTYTDPSGHALTKVVRFKIGDTPAVVLPAE